jgi:hypothetical protein
VIVNWNGNLFDQWKTAFSSLHLAGWVWLLKKMRKWNF